MGKMILLTTVVSLFICAGQGFCQEQEKDDPCAEAMTTMEMRECADDRYQKADAELNEVYKQLMVKLEEARQAKLKEAQRAWIAFRDKSAEFEASEAEGGSMYPVILVSVSADMTEARVNELRETLKRLESE